MTSELLMMNTRGLRGPVVTRPPIRSVGNFAIELDISTVLAEGWVRNSPNNYQWDVSRWVSQTFPRMIFLSLPMVNGNIYRIQGMLHVLDGAGSFGIQAGTGAAPASAGLANITSEGYFDESVEMDAGIAQGILLYANTEVTVNEIHVSNFRITDVTP